jgi:hypothetical protein
MPAGELAHVAVHDVETAGQDDVHAHEHDDGLNVQVDVFLMGHEHYHTGYRQQERGDG